MRFWRVWLAGMAAVAIAACGNGSSGSGTALPHGNVLYSAAPGEPDSLDPATGVSGFDGFYLPLIYDPLMNTDPKTLNPTPGLATHWAFIGPDRLTFRIELRHGVRFQDGTPLDAAAVKASLDHYRNARVWFDLDPVESETVVDQYTIDLHLKSPYSPLPAILAGRAGMIVSPTALQRYGKDFSRHPVGAGPFKFQSWQPGAEVDLVRFADYWNKSSVHFNGVDIKVIADTTAMTNAVRAGQIDLAPLTNANAAVIAAMRRDSSVNTLVTNVNGLALITTNNKVPPFNNVLVRRAFEMAVNRQQLSDAVNGRGVGAGPAWEYEAPTYWTYSKDIPNYGYHPEEARRLLAQAGYPNGVTVQICNYNPDTTAVQIEQQNMAAAGIILQISQEPVNSCVAKMRNASIPLVQIGWIGQASPYQTFQTMFSSSGTGSFGPYENVDALLAKIAATYTQEEQKPLYDQLNKTLYEQAPSIPLYYLVSVVSYSKRLHGLVTDISGAVRTKQAYFQ
jgi:peptide/nickel transport system substrate-binding protein